MNLRKTWIETFYKIATGSRKARNFFTPVGAMIYGSLILAFVAAALFVDRKIGFKGLLKDPFHIILSIPFFTASMILIGWSAAHFLREKGTPVPFNPPPKLVTAGPYHYTRNPMLTGVFSLLFALGLFFNSISLLFGFTPLFIYINYWELKSIEEPELEKRLGKAYIKYRKRTPMFFPDMRAIFKKKV